MRRPARLILAAIFIVSAALHLGEWPAFSLIEAVGAVGLTTERFHRKAALLLILFLAVSLPLLGPTMIREKTMWWRVPLQLVWMAAVGWSAKLMKLRSMMAR